MRHKKLIRVALVAIDFCLIAIVLLAAKNLITENSQASATVPKPDPKSPLSQISPISLATTLPQTALNLIRKPTPPATTANHPMLALINSDRAANNLPPLTLDSNLTSIAQKHSEDMAKENFFSHTNPGGKTPQDRLAESGISFQSAGENIAYAPSLESAHANLMNSKEHRDNILSSAFNNIGIGIALQNSTKIYITEVFTN